MSGGCAAPTRRVSISDASDVGGALAVLNPLEEVVLRVSWKWSEMLCCCKPPTPIRRRELVAALIATAAADAVLGHMVALGLWFL